MGAAVERNILMKYLEAAGLLSIGLLFFIWPVPNTITMRGLLLFSCLAIFVFIASKSASWSGRMRGLGTPFSLIVLFTLWIIVQALFISGEPSWAMSEIVGQWGNGLAALWIGLALGIASEKGKVLCKKNIYLVLFGALLIHVLYIDLTGLIESLQARQMASKVAGLTGGPDKSNYLSILLLLILGAEAFVRAVYKKRMLDVSTFSLIVSLLATLLSIYFEAMRNGTISVALAAVVMLVLLLKEEIDYFSKPVVAFFIIAVISAFVYLSIKADHKWDNVKQTIPIALDTQNNKAWLDLSKYPLPKLQNGEQVERSAYLRIAWIKEGIALVKEHPFGIGFGRNAFGHGIKKKYGEESAAAHSHSGLLDMAVGAGIPGLVLWVGFLMCMMAASLKHFKVHKSGTALLLFLLIISFIWRMSVDSIIRDHMLQQFMFLAGLLYMLTQGEARADCGNDTSCDVYKGAAYCNEERDHGGKPEE